MEAAREAAVPEAGKVVHEAQRGSLIASSKCYIRCHVDDVLADGASRSKYHVRVV